VVFYIWIFGKATFGTLYIPWSFDNNWAVLCIVYLDLTTRFMYRTTNKIYEKRVTQLGGFVYFENKASQDIHYIKSRLFKEGNVLSRACARLFSPSVVKHSFILCSSSFSSISALLAVADQSSLINSNFLCYGDFSSLPYVTAYSTSTC
jgi:hypothetical protein